MFISTLLAVASLVAPGLDDTPLVCPMMGEPVKETSPSLLYAGIKFSFCCGGCDTAFAKAPEKALEKNVKQGKTIGLSLFDPVTGKRINPDQIKATTDYKSIRYGFASAENLKKFEANKDKYAAIPAKEVMTCPVSGEAVASYDVAGGYVDHAGVRYYTCCAGCNAGLAKNPAGAAAKMKGKEEAVRTRKAAGDKSAKAACEDCGDAGACEDCEG